MAAMLKKSLAIALIVAACGGAATVEVGPTAREDLPATTAGDFEVILAGLDRPAVVNVWASWCLPCRAEAPLLNTAFAQYGEKVVFIGLDVQDNQTDAKAFLDEFGLDFGHYFDRQREVANHYLGIGTPITFFFDAGGDLVATHNGVLDERTLALNIDELLALGT